MWTTSVRCPSNLFLEAFRSKSAIFHASQENCYPKILQSDQTPGVVKNNMPTFNMDKGSRARGKLTWFAPGVLRRKGHQTQITWIWLYCLHLSKHLLLSLITHIQSIFFFCLICCTKSHGRIKMQDLILVVRSLSSKRIKLSCIIDSVELWKCLNRNDSIWTRWALPVSGHLTLLSQKWLSPQPC